MATTAEQLLREGDEALAAADWKRARACFEEAHELDGAPEALDGLSEVANFEADYERAIELKEAAVAAYRERDQRVKASHAARWLAFMHATYYGNYAVASGWMTRAESLLEGVEECAAHGWLILDRAPFSPRPEERERGAAPALFPRAGGAGGGRRLCPSHRSALRRRRPRVRGDRAPRRIPSRAGAD